MPESEQREAYRAKALEIIHSGKLADTWEDRIADALQDERDKAERECIRELCHDCEKGLTPDQDEYGHWGHDWMHTTTTGTETPSRSRCEAGVIHELRRRRAEEG